MLLIVSQGFVITKMKQNYELRRTRVNNKSYPSLVKPPKDYITPEGAQLFFLKHNGRVCFFTFERSYNFEQSIVKFRFKFEKMILVLF